MARTVIGAGYDLLEMRPVGLSLEDIFMQLTREEPEPPEVSDAGLEVADDTTTDEKIPESD